MESIHIEKLFAYAEKHHPRSITGLRESRSLNTQAFARIAGEYLLWCEAARGETGIYAAVDAFARFSSDVNLAQARYELTGHYENKSFSECYEMVYDQSETMSEYLWGVYLSNFLWAHHLDLMQFFEERFLRKLSPQSRLVEIAPGHGGWGLWALKNLPQATLKGFDVSSTSIEIANSLASASGLSDRANYEVLDAVELYKVPSPQSQACICCFLVEHLERPTELMKSIAHVVEPGGLAFFTGALTAAQVDHIYEFKNESELVFLAEQAGFRVLESRSVAPNRLLHNAKYLPRSMALIMKKNK